MRDYFSLVTFSHTVFALPFALIGFTLGVLEPGTVLVWTDLLLVVACMVTARSAAMAFNRLVDAGYDAQNARTAIRDIPAGKITPRAAGIFVFVNCAVFILCAGLLNRACLLLSPVALLVVLGYSYTKRFTWLCHLILGVGLALAPVGSYIAVTGGFGVVSCLFGGVVLLWVAGFDIVYALQDESFDRSVGLHSIPTRFGESRSFGLSRWLHLSCFATLLLASVTMAKQWPNATMLIYGSALFFGSALVYQHRLVRPGRLALIDRAFFTTNGVASVVYAGLLVGGLVVLG